MRVGSEGDRRDSPKGPGPTRTLTSLRRAASGPQRRCEWLTPLWGGSRAHRDPGSPRSRCASRQVRQHQRPARARDHGHWLVGPGGGWAGSGGRVGELVWAIKGSESVLAGDQLHGNGHSLGWSGPNRLRAGMRHEPWAIFVYPPHMLCKHRWVLPSIKSPATCLSIWNLNWL